MRLKRCSRKSRRRSGSMGVTMAAGMMLSLFIGAIAVDVGWLMVTRTQMQATADAAALAGGTELLPGLGRSATETPRQVAEAATPVAVGFAAANRAGDVKSAYLDPQRDVHFGNAVFNPETGTWEREWGVAPYNMIGTTLHRDQSGSGNGDQPLPLFFARVMGRLSQNLIAHATAVIVPVKGFKVDEGGESANVMPFAYRESYWRRLQAAQEWYKENQYIPGMYDPLNPGGYPADAMWYDEDQDKLVPMFHSPELDDYGEPVFDKKTGEAIYIQDMFDNFDLDEDTGDVTGTDDYPAPDGWLEVNVYPRDFKNLTAGNAGTIDLGETNNAASELSRQIVDGLSADDFASLNDQGLLDENGALVADPSSDPPITVEAVEGDTGLSVSIKAALDEIVGEPKAVALFNDVWGAGNGTFYTLTEFVGVSVVDVGLTDNPKAVWMQMATFVDGTGVADISAEIGDDTTIFSPLILID